MNANWSCNMLHVCNSQLNAYTSVATPIGVATPMQLQFTTYPYGWHDECIWLIGVFIYMYIYIYTSWYTYVLQRYIHIYIYIYMYLYICIHIYIYTLLYVFTYTHHLLHTTTSTHWKFKIFLYSTSQSFHLQSGRVPVLRHTKLSWGFHSAARSPHCHEEVHSTVHLSKTKTETHRKRNRILCADDFTRKFLNFCSEPGSARFAKVTIQFLYKINLHTFPLYS